MLHAAAVTALLYCAELDKFTFELELYATVSLTYLIDWRVLILHVQTCAV